ncbi:hypothetical protein Fot_55315 [Forsythia ovata]|uniref:Uncharacterized protein n=1 Tax=Forsythia ovata TaxID=205694 RepID=A0ABD1P5V3_9LAMI
MGNNIGGRKRAKIMKINGEVFKVRIPAVTRDVLNDYPGHVLLEKEAVNKYGIRAQPLDPEEELKAKKIYFLVELPKMPQDMIASRQRSVSDHRAPGAGSVRMKMRLAKPIIEKLIQESKDENELAEKIIHLCLLQN